MQLFERLEDSGNEFTVRVSFLEIYNEDVFDLLSPVDDHSKLRVFEDTKSKGSVIIQSKYNLGKILRPNSLAFCPYTAAPMGNASCDIRSC